MSVARVIRVRGVVQGVGFRPFVFRLATALAVRGWVRNDGGGVDIHVEGEEAAIAAFLETLVAAPPPSAQIGDVDVRTVRPQGCPAFEIRHSALEAPPTARIAPDTAVCPSCVAEMGDRRDRRYGYPYITCTDCGPRYSIMVGLPYDRPATTMRDWAMCAACEAEYRDPLDRRFHAQPVACGACGPHYVLRDADRVVEGDGSAIDAAAALLRGGRIVAVKGIGGFHLACDAASSEAVRRLRARKFRKERPFAVMVPTVDVARQLVHLSPETEALLASPARPIVLAPAKIDLDGVAPDHRDLGVMLAYAPVHHLLYAAGAPTTLVMTSANRSSEPIAYGDEEALQRLAGIADAFLMGQRPIARRIDDSVATAGPFGPMLLRRARGYAPGAVARLPAPGPVLALGADLKSAVTLVVDGDAFVSQHIGDLEHYDAYQAFQATIRDLMAMYHVAWDDVVVAYDLHPQYASSAYAAVLPAARRCGVQHHRAHVASVLAERGALDQRVLGLAFDGTGYGDDGAIWGGEFFLGSVGEGFERIAHLRAAALPGGDAAARHPVQAAAGFLAGIEGLPDLSAPPFCFPARYRDSRALIDRGVRCFATTSVGRLFDTVAALLGFTRAVSYEGQAAVWLEQLAAAGRAGDPCPVPFERGELDFRPALVAVTEARRQGRAPADVARAFHEGLADGITDAVSTLCEDHGVETVVLSGGVFQNRLLLHGVAARLAPTRLRVWVNHTVPANDGGISLGQAALAVSAST
jgi:hydrogenase maturation protein HypF